MSRAKLSIILLNYANWSDTLECLESLTRSSYKSLSVIVVDSGSPDDSVERLCAWVDSGEDARPHSEVWRQFPTSQVQRPRTINLVQPESKPSARSLPRFADSLTIVPSGRRLGFAAGCNAGLQLALQDPEVRYLWLLNNDTVVAPDALSHLVQRANSAGESLGALGTLVADYRDPDVIQILGGGRLRRISAEPCFSGHGLPIADANAYAEDATALDYISGASLVTTPSTIHLIGGLDSTMHLYWEDTDWCTRMRASGLRLEVCLQALVWHKGHASTGGINPYTKFHNFRSAAIYMRRHRKLWLAPLVVRLSKSLVRDILAARPLDALAAIRGLSAGLRVPRAAPRRPLEDTLQGGHSAGA